MRPASAALRKGSSGTGAAADTAGASERIAVDAEIEPTPSSQEHDDNDEYNERMWNDIENDLNDVKSYFGYDSNDFTLISYSHCNMAKTQKPSKNPQKPSKTLGFWQKPTTHGQNTKNPGFFTTLGLAQGVF